MGNEQSIDASKGNTMTFDDGVLEIYELKNVADIGNKPNKKLKFFSAFCFGFDAVSFNRYYVALNAKERIDTMVHIWQDRGIKAGFICVLEDRNQYSISQIQHVLNNDGLAISRLSLTRLDENYAIEN